MVYRPGIPFGWQHFRPVCLCVEDYKNNNQKWTRKRMSLKISVVKNFVLLLLDFLMFRAKRNGTISTTASKNCCNHCEKESECPSSSPADTEARK